MQADRRILLVHAHPDDETIGNGATMARYAAEGAQVTLVTCTQGELGEIVVPELAHLGVDGEDRLGEVREKEMAEAMMALGVDDHRWLGGPGRYRDSGMMGTTANDHANSFWRADLLEAADHLVAIIREVRPQVLVTYDEFGGYGHPDHIQTHRVATYAHALAVAPSYRRDLGEPWDIAKVYWTAFPESTARAGMEALREAGEEVPFDVENEKADERTPFVPDELVTTRVHAEEYVEQKMAAMRAHATQIAVDGFFFALSNNLGTRIWGAEYYRLVRGTHVPDPETGVESDLFAGIG